MKWNWKNIRTDIQKIFVSHIQDIQGNIEFTNDTTYWQANSFQFVFQNATSFWILGGNDVRIYGMWPANVVAIVSL